VGEWQSALPAQALKFEAVCGIADIISESTPHAVAVKVLIERREISLSSKPHSWPTTSVVPVRVTVEPAAPVILTQHQLHVAMDVVSSSGEDDTNTGSQTAVI
jgi:hypothetical protein